MTKANISVIIPRLPDSKYDAITERCVNSYKHVGTEIIVISENHAFAKNVNAGLKRANGDFLLVSNNDVIALPGWYEYVVADRELGILSLTQRSDCGWGFVIPRQIYDLVGLLDENLCNSYEDYDYFIRCALAGYGRVFAPKAYAVHTGGVTLNDVWGPPEAASKVRLSRSSANQIYMKRKWPGVSIDSVPLKHYAMSEVAIMQDWKNKNPNVKIAG